MLDENAGKTERTVSQPIMTGALFNDRDDAYDRRQASKMAGNTLITIVIASCA